MMGFWRVWCRKKNAVCVVLCEFWMENPTCPDCGCLHGMQQFVTEEGFVITNTEEV